MIVRYGDGEARVQVILDPWGPPVVAPTACDGGSSNCSRQAFADGSVALTTAWFAERLWSVTVVLYRPDGTLVLISFGPDYGPREVFATAPPSPRSRMPSQPMTVQQVQTLATNPGLTLFP